MKAAASLDIARDAAGRQSKKAVLAQLIPPFCSKAMAGQETVALFADG